MVFKGRTTDKIRAYVKYHQKDFDKHGQGSKELIDRLVRECKVSRATVYRLLKEPITYEPKSKGGGRPRKIDARTKSRLVRNIPKLRKCNPNWIARDLFKENHVNDVSIRTKQRFLNENGYNFSIARKKGVLKGADKAKRLKFAKEWVHQDEDYWKEGIAFYFDGAGFTHKTKPYEDAMACRGRTWRKRSEGLEEGCTTKGKKVGTGGRQAKFFVAISYDQGVILAHQYDTLNGESFSNFIRENFAALFAKSGKISTTWLQDGDPSQNSAKSRKAQEEFGSTLFSIPPRSPELNPIENVFAFVKKELRDNAIENELFHESYKEFSLRVKNTLYQADKERINKIIGSYGRRLTQVILRKGGKISY